MSENEMIERVARNIAVVTIPNYADDAHWAEHWAWYIRYRGRGGSADYSSLAVAERQARAAIEAMREPTDSMCEAGHWESFPDGRRNGLVANVWRGMIDEALS